MAKAAVSVIIPIHNKEQYIAECLSSVTGQQCRYPIEIICIDDGSTDGSAEIVLNLQKKHTNILLHRQECRGVSAARNKGIELASGKYLLFVDADDALSPNTISDVVDFFERHYDETEIVTYPIFYKRGKRVSQGKRGQELMESAVLNIADWKDFSQTTMNVCVKNTKEIYFREDLLICEDQFYNTEHVLRKNTIGWCCTGKYFYRKDIGGASELSHPRHTFEMFINFYWILRAKAQNDAAREYIHQLFLYNMAWRIKSDMVFPYHYRGETFEQAVDKIVGILDDMSSKEILQNSWLLHEHKIFLLSLKRQGRPIPLLEEGYWALCNGGLPLLEGNGIALTVIRTAMKGQEFRISGYLSSELFNFISGKPELYLCKNSESQKIDVHLAPESCVHSPMRTNTFWGFETVTALDDGDEFSFRAAICGRQYATDYNFAYTCIINSTTGNTVHYARPLSVKFTDGKWVCLKYEQVRQQHWIFHKLFFINQKKRLPLRLCAALLKHWNIELYCGKPEDSDPAFQAFARNSECKDGRLRFFVSGETSLATPFRMPAGICIRFKSTLHKVLFLASKVVYSSFSKESDCVPFGKAFAYYADMLDADILLLGHEDTGKIENYLWK